MNKDVLFTIYEIVHRDLTKQLIAEYHKRLKRCTGVVAFCNNVCTCDILIDYDECFNIKVYNYRVLRYGWSFVYTKYSGIRCDISTNYH